jgi:hypothetical protein
VPQSGELASKEPALAEPAAQQSGGPDYEGPISTEPLISKESRRTTAIVSTIVTVLLVACVVGLGYLLYISYDSAPEGVAPAAVRLRDIGIIVMALETIVGMVLLLIISVMLAILIVLVYDRVIPILEEINRAIGNAADAAHTVRGTTEFVSEKVVSPMIEVSALASGAARIVKGIVDLWPWRKK